MCYI